MPVAGLVSHSVSSAHDNGQAAVELSNPNPNPNPYPNPYPNLGTRRWPLSSSLTLTLTLTPTLILTVTVTVTLPLTLAAFSVIVVNGRLKVRCEEVTVVRVDEKGLEFVVEHAKVGRL